MKNCPVLFLFLLLFTWASCQNRLEYSIVIHGGAGNITPHRISAEAASNIEAKLSEALDRGTMILEKGGSSLDAVVEVIKILEDSPLFNAGKGAVFNHEGKNELDASIMEGLNLMAGAVTGVGDIKNPIIIGISIPISIITTLIFMYFLDINFNIVSLGGLALGIGLLVPCFKSFTAHIGSL